MGNQNRGKNHQTSEQGHIRTVNTRKTEKEHQTSHINSLKEFQVCQQPVRQQLLVCAVKDEEGTWKFFLSSTKEAISVDLSHLSPPQQEAVKPLQDQKLFFGNQGSYPTRYMAEGKCSSSAEEQMLLMLELGIIEVSSSECGSPIFLVPKKDG